MVQVSREPMRREVQTGLSGDVPIVLSQWYDTAKWILEKIDKFPKNQRFIFGTRLADRTLGILEGLVQASYTGGREKLALLETASRDLAALCWLVRMAKDLGCYKSVLMDVLTDRAHAKNAKDDHTKMLTARELMILSRWADTNYQFYGSYYGRQHSRWAKPAPGKSTYRPADFRRKPTFAEAVSKRAPEWHR